MIPDLLWEDQRTIQRGCTRTKTGLPVRFACGDRVRTLNISFIIERSTYFSARKRARARQRIVVRRCEWVSRARAGVNRAPVAAAITGIVRRPPWMKRPSFFFFLLFFIPPPPPPPPLLPPLSSRSASSPRFYPRVAGSSTRSFLRNGGLMRERRGVPRRWGRGSVRPEIPRRTGDLRAGSGVTSRDSGIYAWARVIQRQAVGDSRGCHC